MDWRRISCCSLQVQVKSQSLLCFEIILFIQLEVSEVSVQLPCSAALRLFWSCVCSV